MRTYGRQSSIGGGASMAISVRSPGATGGGVAASKVARK